MSKATKGEATAWLTLARDAASRGDGLSAEMVSDLATWLERVAASLPTQAAIQRDRERRRAAVSETCSVCGEERTRPGGFCACLP